MRIWNDLKTTLLLAALMALCMGVGRVLGGQMGLVYGFVFGCLGSLVSYFMSDRIALAAVGAQEIPAGELSWLRAMVTDLCERAQIPLPRLYVFPQAAPNAFATGRNPRHAAVAISSGMLQNFPQREIEGVLAHELSHVKHRDMRTATIAACMAGLISGIAQMAFWFGGSRDRDSNPIVGLLMLILAPIAATIIQLAISRQREYAADSRGGELCGDPNKLADALQRLEGLNERIPTSVNPAFHSLFIMQPFSGQALTSLFSTHPPTEQRIERLREQARRNR